MISKLKKMTHGENSLKGASAILVVTLFLSNVLGFVRNYLLTRNLPVESTDMYFAAFRLPDLVLNLLILGAISSALMPVFNGYLQKDDEKRAWYVANAVITIALITLTSAIVLLFFLMPYVIHLIVPYFSGIERDQTVTIARIMLLSPLLFGISYLYTGVLNSYKRFFAPAIAPLIYNLSIIIGAGVLAPMFHRGDPRQTIYLAISVVAGAFLHMYIQLPAMRHVGFKFRWIADIKDKSVRQVGKLMVPRTIGLGSNQIMFTIFTALASAKTGNVTYFTLANDVQTMPSVVFGLSFATAVFPSLSTAYTKEDTNQFTYYTVKTMRIVIALLIPISALMILLKVGIIRALFGFSFEGALVAAKTLAFFAISLVFSGLVPLLARCFFAMENTVMPTIISVAASISSVVAAWFLRGYGAPGLALAFSIGSILNATILYIALKKHHQSLDEKAILLFTGKVLAITLVMSFIVQEFKGWTSQWFDVVSRSGMFIQVIICGLVGVGIYVALAKLVKIKEVENIWRRGVRD